MDETKSHCFCQSAGRFVRILDAFVRILDAFQPSAWRTGAALVAMSLAMRRAKKACWRRRHGGFAGEGVVGIGVAGKCCRGGAAGMVLPGACVMAADQSRLGLAWQGRRQAGSA